MRSKARKSRKQGQVRKVNLPIESAHEPETETKNEVLRKLVAEEMTRAARERGEKARAEREKCPARPRAFTQGIFQLRAGQLKLTPRQLFRYATMKEEIGKTPEDIRNWFAKIAGDFSKPPLADLLEEIYLRVLKDESRLVMRLDEAIRSGNIKWLEELTSCVAFIHRIPYTGNGQARRVAGGTARNVILTFTRLFEQREERPSATEIRVEMARYVCLLENDHRPPKFSDIWYLLRSGPKDDAEPGPSSRYEVTGIKNIKKTLKSMKVTVGTPLRGPLTEKKVKFILDKWGLGYVDDSESVPEILR
jgi:hypothetical protein